MTHFQRFLAAFLVLVAGFVSAAQAQDDLTVPRAAATGSPAPGPGEERTDKVPALQYTLAFLFTMLILTIVCIPSRKPVPGD